MEELKSFYVLRYMLIENDQANSFKQELPKPKGKVIESAIIDDREWQDRNIKFSFVGFGSVNATSTTKEKATLYIGKLARLKYANLGEKVKGDIINHMEDDWVGVNLIFEINEQLIFVQKKSKFDNGNVNYLCKKIQSGLEPIVSNLYNYKVFVEPVLVRGRFWLEVSKYKGEIYELDLELISPNILQTNKKARASLVEIEKLYNQDKIDISLKSTTGDLNIPENPIKDYVDYIEEGEGSWCLQVGEDGRRKNIHSSSLADTVILPVHTNDDSNNNTDELRDKNNQLDFGSEEFSSKEDLKYQNKVIERIMKYIYGRNKE